jgi:hypothetical protein
MYSGRRGGAEMRTEQVQTAQRETGQEKISRRGFLKLGLASISATAVLFVAGCAGEDEGDDEGDDDDDRGRRRRRRR